jgi:hypothetical protein
MTFGLSAIAVGAITAGVAVGTAVYTADQQRKAMHKAGDALKEAQKQDALEAAQANTSAAKAANETLADTRRRRRASSLSAGAPDAGLGSGSVLGAGSQPVSVASQPSAVTSALGKGAV